MQAAAPIDPDAAGGQGLTQDELRRYFGITSTMPPAMCERIEKLVTAWRILSEDEPATAERIYRLAECEYADNLDAEAEARAENSAMRGAEGGRL